MPRYDYECYDCKGVVERVYFMAEKPDRITCPFCAGWMRSIIKGVMVLGDNHNIWEPYWDENLGEKPIYVKSREHRKALMKERGLEDGNPVNQKRLKEKMRDIRASGNTKLENRRQKI